MIYLTYEDKKIVMTLAGLMAAVDGKFLLDETVALLDESARMKVDFEPLMNAAETVDPNYAINYVSKMSADEKKYVFSVLYKVMVIDGEKHPHELSLLTMIASLANIPWMTHEEVAAFLKTQK